MVRFTKMASLHLNQPFAQLYYHTVMSVSPTGSPIQPLHNPLLAAQVVVPEAPLGNTSSLMQASTIGAKALLAKKLAHNA